MDGSFSKYATTSSGDIGTASIAALIGRASTIPFACTIRYGFCQSRASLTELYFLGSDGGMRFLSGDATTLLTLSILVGCKHETKAIAAPRKTASRLRVMYCILV